MCTCPHKRCRKRVHAFRPVHFVPQFSCQHVGWLARFAKWMNRFPCISYVKYVFLHFPWLGTPLSRWDSGIILCHWVWWSFLFLFRKLVICHVPFLYCHLGNVLRVSLRQITLQCFQFLFKWGNSNEIFKQWKKKSSHLQMGALWSIAMDFSVGKPLLTSWHYWIKSQWLKRLLPEYRLNSLIFTGWGKEPRTNTMQGPEMLRALMAPQNVNVFLMISSLCMPK